MALPIESSYKIVFWSRKRRRKSKSRRGRRKRRRSSREMLTVMDQLR